MPPAFGFVSFAPKTMSLANSVLAPTAEAMTDGTTEMKWGGLVRLGRRPMVASASSLSRDPPRRERDRETPKKRESTQLKRESVVQKTHFTKIAFSGGAAQTAMTRLKRKDQTAFFLVCSEGRRVCACRCVCAGVCMGACEGNQLSNVEKQDAGDFSASNAHTHTDARGRRSPRRLRHVAKD